MKSVSGLFRMDRPEGIRASCGKGGAGKPLMEIYK